MHGFRRNMLTLSGTPGFTPCGEFMITYALYRSITKCFSISRYMFSRDIHHVHQRLYAYDIGWSVRWVYLSTSVWIQPEPERRRLDSDRSAEITHLARQPIPHAISRTLQVFLACLWYFYWHIYDTYTEINTFQNIINSRLCQPSGPRSVPCPIYLVKVIEKYEYGVILLLI